MGSPPPRRPAPSACFSQTPRKAPRSALARGPSFSQTCPKCPKGAGGTSIPPVGQAKTTRRPFCPVAGLSASGGPEERVARCLGREPDPRRHRGRRPRCLQTSSGPRGSGSTIALPSGFFCEAQLTPLSQDVRPRLGEVISRCYFLPSSGITAPAGPGSRCSHGRAGPAFRFRWARAPPGASERQLKINLQTGPEELPLSSPAKSKSGPK